MPLNQNINPYYNDFDPTKDYQQILFKPGFPVQARELTQLQSIAQNQVTNLGGSIYQQGSIVIPGKSRGDLAVPYVQLASTYNGNAVDPQSFVGLTIVGATSGVKAYVKYAIEPTLTDPSTIYVSYLSAGVVAGVPNGLTTFAEGEEIYVQSNPAIAATVGTSSTSIGVGSMVYINEGVYYVNGYFVTVNSQSIVISKYDSLPSCNVLLQIKESFVDYTTDNTLLDPSQGSYNYAAPGADRYKIELILTSLPLTATIDNNYVLIMQYNQGVLQENNQTPKYSELDKSLAQRTFDEAGNFVVSGLTGTVKEDLKTARNGGIDPNGSIDDYAVTVSAGSAYINGFQVQKIAATNLVQPKARTASHIKTKTVNVRPTFGRYIYVTNVEGGPSIATREQITLTSFNGIGYASIGTARVLSIEYAIGDPSSIHCVYKLYVTDVVFTSTAYSSVNIGGILFSTGSAAVVQTINTNLSSGTYNIGDIVQSPAVARSAEVAYWDYTTGTLYVYKNSPSLNIPILGDLITDTTTSANSVVQGVQSYFGTDQNSAIFQLPTSAISSLKNTSNVYDNNYYVQKQLQVTTSSSGGASITIGDGIFETPAAGTFVAVYSGGSVNPTLFSLSGADNVLNLTGGPVSTVVYIYANVIKNALAPRTKSLTTVTGETYSVSTSISSLQLENCDIYSLTQVLVGGVDMTSQFILNNGQTDYGYYNGSISLPTGGSLPLGTYQITYQYFAHTSGDYFSVDSYSGNTDYLDLIVNYKNSSGAVFNLLNCLDARPTVNSSGNFGSGAIVGDMFVYNELYKSSMQYFVPRYDLLTIDKDSNLLMIQGTPAEVPTIPSLPTGMFALENYFVPAYTYTINSIVKSRNLVDRYTMQNIAQLDQRISNLEQFSVLSQSESSTINYDVVDPSTGISRFKTGYLVENFTTPFTIADMANLDFAASFDNNTMGSALERMNCPVTILNTSTSFVSNNGVISLPYTESTFATQPLSSRVVNVNPFTMISWSGHASVTPAIDTWVDIVDLPTVFQTVTAPTINITNYVPNPNAAAAIPASNIPVSSPNIIDTIADGVGSVVGGVVNVVGNVVSTAANAVGNVVSGIGHAVSSVVNSVVHCCVVATALTKEGDWSKRDYYALNKWAIEVLDTSSIGRHLHKGYHILGPKVMIPLLKQGGLSRKYIKYTFENGAKLLQLKKVPLLSIPNSIAWYIAFLTVGLFVTQDYATKTWKKLYAPKDRK